MSAASSVAGMTGICSSPGERRWGRKSSCRRVSTSPRGIVSGPGAYSAQSGCSRADNSRRVAGAWIWDYVDGRWRRLRADDCYPGQTIIVDATWGGYDTKTGFTGAARGNKRTPYLPRVRSRFQRKTPLRIALKHGMTSASRLVEDDRDPWRRSGSKSARAGRGTRHPRRTGSAARSSRPTPRLGESPSCDSVLHHRVRDRGAPRAAGPLQRRRARRGSR